MGPSATDGADARSDGVIAVRAVTKRCGGSTAVEDLSFEVRPGVVTRQVGALLDAGAVEGGRRARDHLRWVARAARLPRGRVDEVLAAVGLAGAADTRVRAPAWGCASDSGSPPRCSSTRRR
jgi:ABC-type multidrug transport system ATPase subunit